MACEMQGATIE